MYNPRCLAAAEKEDEPKKKNRKRFDVCDREALCRAWLEIVKRLGQHFGELGHCLLNRTRLLPSLRELGYCLLYAN